MAMTIPADSQEEADEATRLPRLIDVGGEPMLLRLMEADDADRVHAFFLELPSADLLFLRRDVTDGRAINDWVSEIEQGATLTLVALSEGTVMGEATLYRTGVPWSRHVGIVRVFTAAMQRGRGLGRLLLEELCRLAPSLGVEKLVAEMTVEQAAAQGLMAQLGFVEEARLRGYVKDRLGQPHDLVMMTRDMAAAALAGGAEAVSAIWRCTACGVVTHAAEPPNACPDCGASAGFVVPADDD